MDSGTIERTPIMGKVIAGRMTHRHEGELVVFHIGMRVNRPWRPDLWLPVMFAMPGMLRELSEDPDSGLIGFSLLLGRNGPYTVQYWDSVDKLYAYASDPAQQHRPAWARFNRMARRAPGAVGVWHETYAVARAETMYVSTPAMGLAAATEVMPVGRANTHARDRLTEGAARIAA
jgi:Monooxygenase af470-like